MWERKLLTEFFCLQRPFKGTIQGASGFPRALRGRMAEQSCAHFMAKHTEVP